MSLVIYHYAFGIEYFSLLHNLVIAVVLAVGADDIFVFNDNFVNAGKMPYLKKNINRRIAYAFRKSAKAMFVTSLTTMVSFMSTSITSIVPVKTFGVFAAIAIPVNYLLIILAFPSCFIFYEKYLSNKCFWTRCQCCRKSKKKSKRTSKSRSGKRRGSKKSLGKNLIEEDDGVNEVKPRRNKKKEINPL